MKKLLVSLVALAALVSPAAAQEGSDLARLLSHEAPVVDAPGGALVRVPLTAEVLGIARADLSDVRLVDARGDVVPYLVDAGERPLPSDRPQRLVATTREVLQSRDGSRRDPGLFRERYELTAPPEPAQGAVWWLELTVARERWVRSLRITLVSEDGSEQIVFEGSAFRLPYPVRARESFALPRVEESARVVVELAGEDEYAAPFFTWVAQRDEASAASLVLPLDVRSVVHEARRTIVTLTRPIGVMPDRLRIRTSTPDFHRYVEVRDARPGEVSRGVGRGAIHRVEALDGATADTLAIEATRGETLELVLEDGDSPPLSDLGVEALVRRPALLARPGSGAMLRFGGGRVTAQRYDLEGLLGRAPGDRLLASPLPEARLGEIRPSPSFDPSPALAFAMRAGREVELQHYAVRAALAIERTGEGLHRVTPSASLLAAAREDLADLRVIDAEGHQWPYFLGASREEVEVELGLEGAEVSDDASSRTRLTLPVSRASVARVVLDVSAPFFDRRVRVLGIDASTGEERVLADRRIERAPASPAQPVVLSLSSARVSSLVLAVEDGDDAPLAIASARAVLLTPEVFVVAPEGAYEVIAGREDASPPGYELARVRSLVLQIPASAASLGDVRGNPVHHEPAWWERAGSATLALWAVLVLAVLVLGALTLHLARKAPPEPAPSADAEASEGSATEDIV